MKLLLKILAGLVIIIFALIIILPIVFKGEIIDLAKKEINKNVNATIDFSDMDVSLIKNFPNFSLTIEDLSVVGKEEYAGDTMADIKVIGIVIDLFSVISGDTYEVKKIAIESPKFQFTINEVGQANYDISLHRKKVIVVCKRKVKLLFILA